MIETIFVILALVATIYNFYFALGEGRDERGVAITKSTYHIAYIILCGGIPILKLTQMFLPGITAVQLANWMMNLLTGTIIVQTLYTLKIKRKTY